MDVLKTNIGKKKVEQADQVIHNGTTYTSKQFIKMFPSTTDVDWNNVVENNIKWDKKKKAKGKGQTGKEKTKTGKNKVNESDKAKRQKKKLSPEAKKGYDDAIDGVINVIEIITGHKY